MRTFEVIVKVFILFSLPCLQITPMWKNHSLSCHSLRSWHWSPVSLSPSRRMLCCHCVTGQMVGCSARGEDSEDSWQRGGDLGTRSILRPPAREDTTSQPEASSWPQGPMRTMGSARPGWSLINTQLLPLDRTTRHSWLHRPGGNLKNADKSRLEFTFKISFTGV